jgi:hypothetical protein
LKFKGGDSFEYGFKDNKISLIELSAIAKIEKGAAVLK